jgi:hypothetical protein
MEFVDVMPVMGPELVTPSRCAARASFGVDISEGLGEVMGGEIAFRVLAASAGGCSGRSLMRITSVSNTATGTHLASSRLCVNLDVKFTYISALRCGMAIS